MRDTVLMVLTLAAGVVAVALVVAAILVVPTH